LCRTTIIFEYAGLTENFDVDRRLTPREIEFHLPQNEPSPSPPHYQLSVIKMNSTFLEVVDKYYFWKGGLSFLALLLSIPAIIFIVAIALDIFTNWEIYSGVQKEEHLNVLVGLLFVFVLWMAVIWYFFHKESFTFTHWPIRFNRKNRMVYAFRVRGGIRPNKGILRESWDKLYFVLTNTKQDSDTWDVRAHILSDDGKRVQETFALSHSDSYRPEMKNSPTFSQWEFIRRYMEEGPEKLIGQVEYTLDIADKRESFVDGYLWLLKHFNGYPIAIVIFAVPMFFFAIGRWVGIHTSRIPKWPDDIEIECAVDPNDPYIRDATHPVPLGMKYDPLEALQ